VEVLSFLRMRLESRGFVEKFVLGSRWDGKFDKYVKTPENYLTWLFKLINSELLDVEEDLACSANLSFSKTSSTTLRSIKQHIEVSSNYLQEITSAVDMNTGRLVAIADGNREHHAQIREWHHEETERLQSVGLSQSQFRLKRVESASTRPTLLPSYTNYACPTRSPSFYRASPSS
jgi:hypothetical protein